MDLGIAPRIPPQAVPNTTATASDNFLVARSLAGRRLPGGVRVVWLHVFAHDSGQLFDCIVFCDVAMLGWWAGGGSAAVRLNG